MHILKNRYTKPLQNIFDEAERSENRMCYGTVLYADSTERNGNIMKKVWLVLLSLVMVLTLVACKKEPCTAHVDADANNICDECGAEMPPAGDPPCTAHVDANNDEKCDICGTYVAFTDEQASAVLAGAILAQLDAVRSMKVDFSAKVLNVSEYWNEGELEADKEYVDGILNGTIIATLTEEDIINAKIEIEYLSRESAEDEYEVDEDSAVIIYMVDGMYYEYDTDLKKYEATPMVEEEEDDAWSEFLDVLFDLEATEAEKNEAIKLFGDAFVATFDYENKKASFAYDYKAEFEEEYNYLKGLDLETVTLKAYFDDALEKLDPELSTDALLDKISENLDLTILGAYDAFDAWLTEEYETTVQEVFELYIVDERLPEIISAALKADGASQEQIDEILAELEEMKTFKLREELDTVLTENEAKEVTLYDIISVMLVENEIFSEIPAKEEIFDAINDVLDMTIAEYEEEFEPVISNLIESAEAFDFDEGDVKIDITFNDVYAVESVDLALNVDVVYSEDSFVEGKKDVDDFKMEITCKLYELSVGMLEIEAPGEDDIVLVQ